MDTRAPGEGEGGPKCKECRKPARFLVSNGLVCGTHAYEYIIREEPGSGLMPAMIRPQPSRHVRGVLRP